LLNGVGSLFEHSEIKGLWGSGVLSSDGTIEADGRDNDSRTLSLLNAIHADSRVTQRSVAQTMGVALGLANAYLKRCVRKGLVKVTAIPANRYAYYLTPQGFAEKSRLTAEFLAQTFNLVRAAQGQFTGLYDFCIARGWRRVAMYGVSDLCDVALLAVRDRPVILVGIVDPRTATPGFAGLPVVRSLDELGGADALIVTDLQNPQAAYDALCRTCSPERILTPALLGVVAVSGMPEKGAVV